MIKISYSRHDLYSRSPRAYYLQYVLKLVPDKYKGAFILGDCFDQAVGQLTLTRDLDAAKTLFKKLFVKYETYLGTLDVLTSDQIEWTKTEGDPKEWLEWKADAALESYNIQVMPHIKTVHAVQEFTKIEDSEGNLIRGYADKIVTWYQDKDAINYDPELDKWNDKIILFDDKLSTGRYSIPDSAQLATYSQSPNIIDVDAQGYIVVNKKFRKIKEPKAPIKITIDTVTEDTIQSVFEGYARTIQGIKMGNFECDKHSCEKSPFPCPYKRFCESNGKDLKGLMYVK